MTVYSKSQLNELAKQLLAVEDWLREKCEARHNDDLADVVLEAFHVIDDLSDEAT